MKRLLTGRAAQDYEDAIPVIQKAFDKQMKLPVENLHHPSIQAKKIDETGDIWQAVSHAIGDSSFRSLKTPISFLESCPIPNEAGLLKEGNLSVAHNRSLMLLRRRDQRRPQITE